MIKICLCMIVKNEAHIIERCIKDVAPYVDGVYLLDTGSTDDTIQIAKRTAKALGLPCPSGHRMFDDFASSRNFALDRARSWEFDYALMIDADETLCINPDMVGKKRGKPRPFHVFLAENPGVQAAYLDSFMSGSTWKRPQLIRLDQRAEWRGVVHEFLQTNDGKPILTVPGVVNFPIQDSARNADVNGKFKKDAKLLERALITAATPKDLIPRYRFYAGMTRYYLGDYAKAIEHFKARAREEGFFQETYVSLWRLGTCLERMNVPPQEVIGAYARAFDYYPLRVEAIHDLAAYCRVQGMYTLAHMFASRAMAVQSPLNDHHYEPLLDEADRYLWRVHDEYTVSLPRLNLFQEALASGNALLKSHGDKIPAADRERIENNVRDLDNLLKAQEQDKATRVASKPAKKPRAPVTKRTPLRKVSKR